jgi:ubiquinone/menaquinone biosynthesis C-methylase UbiE
VVRGWAWDETLFRGTAPYYLRGRIPYPDRLHDAFRDATALDPGARLVDVGCGPGIVALTVADLFAEVVGVDPDGEMLEEAERSATARGIRNASWLRARAEDLPAGLGEFRYATFAQSFHWMDRERVASIMFAMLAPGGSLVHVDTVVDDPAAAAPTSLPHPRPPTDAIKALRERYLGAEQRAGKGVIRYGTPDNERRVLEQAGFESPRRVRVVGRTALVRSVDDVVAEQFSMSMCAPNLFGDQLPDFERDLRDVLAAAADDGRFSAWQGDVDLVFYRRP